MISEMKLQNCNFMEKFRLISCQASFILAIKIVILDKSLILIKFPYWVDVYVRLKDIYLIKCSLQYIYPVPCLL